MPSLGADMETGTVSQWLVQPGDEVHRGQIVAVIETDKSTIEVEIFENGTIDELVVHEGETVPVGAALAHVTTRVPENVAAMTPPTRTAVPPVSAPKTRAGEPAGATPGPPAAPPRGPPSVLSPMVRHLAEELGVDLAALAGSGPGGALTRADVEAAARLGAGGTPRRKRGARKTAVEPVGGRPVQPGAATPSEPAHHTRSSPRARRLAAELGVDLSVLSGTGPGGSVVEDDVRLAAASPAATPTPAPPEQAPVRVSPEDRQAAMRRAIGALMARSKREIPHYYLSTTIDVSATVRWLERANLERPVVNRLVLPVLLLKATARAVARVPEMNGFFVDDVFTPSEAVHVGVAISLRTGGVIAPAIHDTDRLSLDELMTQLRDLVGRTRAGVLRSSEMSDPTITVTNLGDLGVEAVFGVIYPPQVALVGFGRVTERPFAQGGMLGVRPCVTATLSADHRTSDGHRGGRFLAEIDRLLQEPETL